MIHSYLLLVPCPVVEICYNIRYPAKHGREGSSTPWSFRQVGIYHSLNLQTGKSVWILVQCPLSVQLLVDSVQKEDAGLGLHDDQPLMLHYIILIEVLSQWRDYDNYLEAKMQEIVSVPLGHCNCLWLFLTPSG